MNRRNVAFLPDYFNHLTYQGIITYAREAGWSMQLQYVVQKIVPENWHGDGIITFHHDNPCIDRLLRESGVPAVNLSDRNLEMNVPRVLKNETAIGEMAANYFLDRGFHHFSFYKHYFAPNEAPAYHLRKTSFERVIKAKGGIFHDLTIGRFVDNLQDVPKPLALMAENDDCALRALEACEIAGVRVPEEVAILGVDNNPDFCDLAQTPLSSIDSNCQKVGYEAARLLDQLMDGGTPPCDPILVPPNEVITRQSTDILAVPHLPAATALKCLISEHCDPLLDLNQVARQTGISRRNLEIAFKKHLGYTLFDYLERLRVDAALVLLNESDYKGYEIADSCGFSNLDHLNRALRKRFGKSYRQMKSDKG